MGYLIEYYEFDEHEGERIALLCGLDHSRATNAIAEFVRRIGKERATPAVVAQQLKILGLIDNAELSERENLVVATFINVLCGIDAYDQAEETRRLEAERVRVEPEPVPIDETTMEPVDGPLETWER